MFADPVVENPYAFLSNRDEGRLRVLKKYCGHRLDRRIVRDSSRAAEATYSTIVGHTFPHNILKSH